MTKQITAKKSISVVLLIITLIFSLPLSVDAHAQKLIPGGMPFGVKVYSDGVSISGFTDTKDISRSKNPAICSGLRTGDIITEIDGRKISTPEDLIKITQNSSGSLMKLKYTREGKSYQTNIKAIKTSDGQLKLGVNLRDSVAGIGTVTFIDSESGTFGGLGHGICDPYTGSVIPILKGSVCKVDITNIIKGESGAAGEIHGSFINGRTGAVLKNCDKGIFGIFTNIPYTQQKPLDCAESHEVCLGEATILTTLDNNGIKSYKIKIESIDSESPTKNFLIKVTDDELIQKSGGIIQGMSGSPIIQNGKLIGAVTHVMLNDPTKGYGILIEKMLKEVQS